MTVSRSWLHHPTRYPIGLPQKRPMDRFWTVAPSTGVVGEGCSVGGQASLQKYTNKEAALDFTGGIGMAQVSLISDSGKATNESQQVYALSPETRVNHGDQSINKATAQEANTRQKRYRGVRKKPCGEWVAAIRDPRTGAKLSLGTFDTAEKAAAAYKEAACGFKGSQAKLILPQEVRQSDGNAHHSRRRTSHLYVHLLQTPGLSSLPLIQQCVAMTLSNPSLQETVPAVSASALQDPLITKPPNDTEILPGIGEEFELESLYSNVSGCAAEEYFKRLLLTKV